MRTGLGLVVLVLEPLDVDAGPLARIVLRPVLVCVDVEKGVGMLQGIVLDPVSHRALSKLKRRLLSTFLLS